MGKFVSTGTQLYRSTDGETWEAIPNLTTIPSPDTTTEDVDATDHDSTGNEYLSGMTEGGEVAISGWFNSAEARHVGLYADKVAGTNLYWRILYPDPLATFWDFRARVKSFRITAVSKQMTAIEGSLKVNGTPTLDNGWTP